MSRWNQRHANHWNPAPYPGERPECSWHLINGLVHRVVPADGGWLNAATGEAIELADRVFILAYGSNANPNKLRGLDAVMLLAEITDGQAVWCNARRREGSVVSTLVKRLGHVEACPVLALHPRELGIVDSWEKPAYRRIRFWGDCTLENGTAIEAEVYVGGGARPPLKVKGNYVSLHQAQHSWVDRRVPS